MSVNSVPYQGYEERVFEAERSGDGEHGVEAAQQSPEQDELPDVRLHRQASQVEPQRRQVLRVVQSILTHSKQSLSSGRVLAMKLFTGRSTALINKVIFILQPAGNQFVTVCPVQIVQRSLLFLTRSLRFLMARLTAFSVGGSRAFSRNRAIDPSFKIWRARMTVNHKSEAAIVRHSTPFH